MPRQTQSQVPRIQGLPQVPQDRPALQVFEQTAQPRQTVSQLISIFNSASKLGKQLKLQEEDRKAAQKQAAKEIQAETEKQLKEQKKFSDLKQSITLAQLSLAVDRAKDPMQLLAFQMRLQDMVDKDPAIILKAGSIFKAINDQLNKLEKDEQKRKDIADAKAVDNILQPVQDLLNDIQHNSDARSAFVFQYEQENKDRQDRGQDLLTIRQFASDYLRQILLSNTAAQGGFALSDLDNAGLDAVLKSEFFDSFVNSISNEQENVIQQRQKEGNARQLIIARDSFLRGNVNLSINSLRAVAESRFPDQPALQQNDFNNEYSKIFNDAVLSGNIVSVAEAMRTASADTLSVLLRNETITKVLEKTTDNFISGVFDDFKQIQFDFRNRVTHPGMSRGEIEAAYAEVKKSEAEQLKDLKSQLDLSSLSDGERKVVNFEIEKQEKKFLADLSNDFRQFNETELKKEIDLNQVTEAFRLAGESIIFQLDDDIDQQKDRAKQLADLHLTNDQIKLAVDLVLDKFKFESLEDGGEIRRITATLGQIFKSSDITRIPTRLEEVLLSSMNSSDPLTIFRAAQMASDILENNQIAFNSSFNFAAAGGKGILSLRLAVAMAVINTSLGQPAISFGSLDPDTSKKSIANLPLIIGGVNEEDFLKVQLSLGEILAASKGIRFDIPQSKTDFDNAFAVNSLLKVFGDNPDLVDFFGKNVKDDVFFSNGKQVSNFKADPNQITKDSIELTKLFQGNEQILNNIRREAAVLMVAFPSLTPEVALAAAFTGARIRNNLTFIKDEQGKIIPVNDKNHHLPTDPKRFVDHMDELKGDVLEALRLDVRLSPFSNGMGTERLEVPDLWILTLDTDLMGDSRFDTSQGLPVILIFKPTGLRVSTDLSDNRSIIYSKNLFEDSTPPPPSKQSIPSSEPSFSPSKPSFSPPKPPLLSASRPTKSN